MSHSGATWFRRPGVECRAELGGSASVAPRLSVDEGGELAGFVTDEGLQLLSSLTGHVVARFAHVRHDTYAVGGGFVAWRARAGVVAAKVAQPSARFLAYATARSDYTFAVSPAGVMHVVEASTVTRATVVPLADVFAAGTRVRHGDATAASVEDPLKSPVSPLTYGTTRVWWLTQQTAWDTVACGQRTHKDEPGPLVRYRQTQATPADLVLDVRASTVVGLRCGTLYSVMKYETDAITYFYRVSVHGSGQRTSFDTKARTARLCVYASDGACGLHAGSEECSPLRPTGSPPTNRSWAPQPIQRTARPTRVCLRCREHVNHANMGTKFCITCSAQGSLRHAYGVAIAYAGNNHAYKPTHAEARRVKERVWGGAPTCWVSGLGRTHRLVLRPIDADQPTGVKNVMVVAIPYARTQFSSKMKKKLFARLTRAFATAPRKEARPDHPKNAARLRRATIGRETSSQRR